jgi:hypothetical protein
MRFDRMVSMGGLAALLALAACGSVLQAPNPDGGRVACRELAEAACRSRSDCAVNACAVPCGGGGDETFINCYDPASDPRVLCEEVLECPAPCSALPEDSCRTRTDCRVDACPGCGGSASFLRCAASDDPIPDCAAIPCPLRCADMATKEACDARSDCHPVFVDGRDCACAALGCCARFSSCADGATAVCKSPSIICDAIPPHCEGPYVVGYANGCYEGCVRSSDCAVLAL